MSYGLLVGYSTAEKGREERSPLYGMLGLFLVGGLWGFFAGIGFGVVASGGFMGLDDFWLWVLFSSLGAFAGYELLVRGLRLHLSPPRSDAWAAVAGGAAGTAVYFGFANPNWQVLASAVLGWLGFGGGFALGALVHRKGEEHNLGFSSWKYMEHNVGFFGGLGLATAAIIQGVLRVDLSIPLKWVCLILLWFLIYLVSSNNIEHWTFEKKWISKNAFCLFQLGFLISLVPYSILSRTLISSWNGDHGLGVFLLILTIFTVIGTLKFVHSRRDLGSKVVATFAIQLGLCYFLAFLV